MIFEYCLLKAQSHGKFTFNNIDEINSYNYCVDLIYEESIAQYILLFTVSVTNQTEVYYYSFGVPESFDVMQIAVSNYKNGVLTEIHSSFIETTDELEARLFQIDTIVDIYDLDISILQKLLDLREVYFNKKNETELENLV